MFAAFDIILGQKGEERKKKKNFFTHPSMSRRRGRPSEAFLGATTHRTPENLNWETGVSPAPHYPHWSQCVTTKRGTTLPQEVPATKGSKGRGGRERDCLKIQKGERKSLMC